MTTTHRSSWASKKPVPVFTDTGEPPRGVLWWVFIFQLARDSDGVSSSPGCLLAAGIYGTSIRLGLRHCAGIFEKHFRRFLRKRNARSILDAFLRFGALLEHFRAIFHFLSSIIDRTIAFFWIATTMRFPKVLFEMVCVVGKPFFDHTFSLASIFGAS